MADPHLDLFRKLRTRTQLTAGESLYIQERGLSRHYYEHDPYSQVKHLYAAGFSQYEILNLVDLPIQEVLDLLDLVPAELPVYVKMTLEGHTVQEIARELSVTRSIVYYHLHDLGLTPARKRAPEITISQQRRIEEYIAKGTFTMPQIAERVGVTYDQVRAASRRASGRT